MNWSVVTNPTLLITAGIYGLLEFIVTRGGLFGIWLGVLLVISLARYCYAILRAAAQGRTQFPAVSLESCNPLGEVMVLWHIVAFPGLILATAPWQPAGSIIAIIVAVVFPASTAVMGLTSSIAQALNPSALIGIMRTIGRDYVVLVGAYVAIFTSVSLLTEYVIPQFVFITALFTFTVETWALLASFALTGAVIRAHRLDFEIPGEIVPREEEKLRLRHHEWRKDLDRAYASMRSSGCQSPWQRRLRNRRRLSVTRDWLTSCCMNELTDPDQKLWRHPGGFDSRSQRARTNRETTGASPQFERASMCPILSSRGKR
jgi:hypothetical protein